MIFIPVFNPNNELLKLVLRLINNHSFQAKDIYIIDDHSKNSKSRKIFKNLANIGCKIKINEKNIGKGSAIKFAIDFAKINNLNFVLFADGDGQHSDEDIMNIYNIGKETDYFIIGERDFEKAPMINRLSNNISNYLFNKTTKLNLRDTQCGLRLIPKKCYRILSNIKEDKFDFELVSLFELNKNNIFIKKVKIQTIYFKNKYVTNFNKIFDTYKIIRVFLIYKFFR
tara:strand:+ start:262 stop:942 length:681 start_codon:yes stop_codon:yes gene_type:complete